MRESSNITCKTLAVDNVPRYAGKYKSREGYPVQPLGNLSQPFNLKESCSCCWLPKFLFDARMKGQMVYHGSLLSLRTRVEVD